MDISKMNAAERHEYLQNLKGGAGQTVHLDSLVGNYHRPKTRGELKDKLKEGVECEVVTTNASVTMHLLAWLDLWNDEHYTIRQSENEGWSVFVPNGAIETHPKEVTAPMRGTE